MPELPEVETIRRELQAVLPGRRIRRVDVHLAKIVKLSTASFRRRLVGAAIRRIGRRAKLLLIELSNNWTIIIHLKMSGQLIWRPKRGRMRVGGHPIPGGLDGLPNTYSHVVLTLNGGTLFFNDQRQFGFVKLVSTDQLKAWLQAVGYGPEPLVAAFTFDVFVDILRRHARQRIKPTLMDQSVIAGVGNIYADEACFAARIRPARRIATMNRHERRALYRGLRAVMELSLRKKGTSADAYLTTNGQKGGMMPCLKVYGRGGQACRRCGTTITKTVLAGRGTHYCSHCQR